MNELSRRIRSGARRRIKRIILAEGEDPRIIEAAKTVVYECIARPVLLGRERIIARLARSAGLDRDTVTVVDPSCDGRLSFYAEILREIRGIPLEEARESVKDNMSFGMLMLRCGAADGMVCGACEPCADVIGRGSELLGAKNGVCATFLLNMRDGRIFSFSDCALANRPTAEQVCDAAELGARDHEQLTGEGARIAFLSYSTYGREATEAVERMRRAMALTGERYPRLFIGGELRLDAAMDEHVANFRIGADRACSANVLVFPDANSAIVSRRIVQRLTRARVLGPVLRGFSKPVNDLRDRCTAEEIADMVAVTAVQAEGI